MAELLFSSGDWSKCRELCIDIHNRIFDGRSGMLLDRDPIWGSFTPSASGLESRIVKMGSGYFPSAACLTRGVASDQGLDYRKVEADAQMFSRIESNPFLAPSAMRIREVDGSLGSYPFFKTYFRVLEPIGTRPWSTRAAAAIFSVGACWQDGELSKKVRDEILRRNEILPIRLLAASNKPHLQLETYMFGEGENYSQRRFAEACDQLVSRPKQRDTICKVIEIASRNSLSLTGVSQDILPDTDEVTIEFSSNSGSASLAIQHAGFRMQDLPEAGDARFAGRSWAKFPDGMQATSLSVKIRSSEPSVGVVIEASCPDSRWRLD